MDRVRGLNPLLVVATLALGRELGALRVIEVGEGARGHIALLEGVGPGERLEQPAPHNLEAFLGRRGPPRRLDSPHHVAQAVERLAPTNAAHLHVVGLRMRRTLRIRGGQ